MKTEHTPEPWATNGTRIESEHSHGWANDGWIIAGLEGPDAEANARRIVACVNACAGIGAFMLEMLLENKRTVMQDLDDLTNQRDELRSRLLQKMDDCVKAEKQRDELLSSLESMRNKYGEYACEVCEQADCAIASVKGKA